MTKPFCSIAATDPRLALIPDQPGTVRGLSAVGPLISGSTFRYTIQRSPDQRSPDRRASLLRRRQHAATGPLPPNLAAGFTTGELAVLKVLADEWLAHGACDRSLNEIASRAGVCRSLAKRTVRLAELDGLVTVLHRPRSGRKHLPNIVRIIRAEWIDWLNKGRRKTYAVNACNRAKPVFTAASQERAGSRGVQNNLPRSQQAALSERNSPPRRIVGCGYDRGEEESDRR